MNGLNRTGGECEWSVASISVAWTGRDARGKAVEEISGAALTSTVNNKVALSLKPLSLIGIYGK